MATVEKGLVSKSYLTATADAIRSKLGTTTTYKPSEFAEAIGEIGGVKDRNLVILSCPDISDFVDSSSTDAADLDWGSRIVDLDASTINQLVITLEEIYNDSLSQQNPLLIAYLGTDKWATLYKKLFNTKTGGYLANYSGKGTLIVNASIAKNLTMKSNWTIITFS